MTETDWLAFLRQLEVPPLEAVPSASRLVVVAPHPDDEVLACGGLIATHAAAGGEVLVVAVTDGGASHPDDPSWPADELVAERRLESARGLAHLAPARLQVVRLGLPDGDVPGRIAELTTALRDVLRPDDRVVTTWRSDGHPDHEATCDATLDAARTIGCEVLEAPVWMWHHREPGDAAVPWPRLRALALTGTALAAKQRALAEHRTQWTPRAGGAAPILDQPILDRADREIEYYFVGARSGAVRARPARAPRSARRPVRPRARANAATTRPPSAP